MENKLNDKLDALELANRRTGYNMAKIDFLKALEPLGYDDKKMLLTILERDEAIREMKGEI